jgi:hypothetical protein
MPDITLSEDQVQAVLNAAGSRSPSVARAMGLAVTVEPGPATRPDPAETAASTYNVGAPKVAEPVVAFEPEMAGPDKVLEEDGA